MPITPIGSTLGVTSRDVLTNEDMFAGEGGLLKRRGKVLYQSDFSQGYDGFTNVFNASGSSVTPPLSLIDYPHKGLRIAAPGVSRGQGTSADAILRLSRPRRDAFPLVSLSFRYSLATEYSYDTVSTADAPGAYQLGFGLDTQAWDNTERQFFQVISRPIAASSSDRYYLRTHRSEGGSIQVADLGSLAQGSLIGENENKANTAYARLTVRPGPTPDYVEMQIGGQVYDLRGKAANISEPLQLSATDYWSNFRGGMNPHFEIQSLSSLSNLTAAALTVSDVTVTYGDELA